MSNFISKSSNLVEHFKKETLESKISKISICLCKNTAVFYKGKLPTINIYSRSRIFDCYNTRGRETNDPHHLPCTYV